MGSREERIAELGWTLPAPLPAVGLYSPVVVDGDRAWTSGALAMSGSPLAIDHAGCLGDDLTVEEGQASARAALLGTLANLRAALGDLDRIERFLKVVGYVRAAPAFAAAPKVLDGASALLRDLFGPDLLPARSAVGVSALPGGASVELDTVVKLRS